MVMTNGTVEEALPETAEKEKGETADEEGTGAPLSGEAIESVRSSAPG